MSKKSIIEALLESYIKGRLSPEENIQFFDLLSDSTNADFFRELLMQNLYNSKITHEISGSDPDFSNIFNRIVKEISVKDSEAEELRSFKRKSISKRIIFNISAAAAVFAFAFFIGRLTIQNEVGKTEPSVSMYEVKAPFGSRSEIKLPDGTTVILNAGSLLSYRNDYNNSNRTVTLKGEAYFKVEKNESVPFVVNAGPLSIMALGTEFNVKAYDDEKSIETTLITGKVEITHQGSVDDTQVVDLNPNQKAIFVRTETGYLLENVRDLEKNTIATVPTILPDILIAPQINIDQTVAWTEGKLILRGESLDRLCVDLERKYDVTIIFREEEIKRFRFTGVLLDETLEQVLNVIKLTAPITYSLDGKTVYLDSDPTSTIDYPKHIK